MCNTHAQIKDFDFKIPGRDVLDKVVSSVGLSLIDDVDLVPRAISGSKLERAEEWYTYRCA